MILNLNIFRNRCSPIYTEITIHKFASKWSLKFKKKKTRGRKSHFPTTMVLGTEPRASDMFMPGKCSTDNYVPTSASSDKMVLKSRLALISAPKCRACRCAAALTTPLLGCSLSNTTKHGKI